MPLQYVPTTYLPTFLPTYETTLPGLTRCLRRAADENAVKVGDLLCGAENGVHVMVRRCLPLGSLVPALGLFCT
eukprot:3709283-Rhodomonas_salina.1